MEKKAFCCRFQQRLTNPFQTLTFPLSYLTLGCVSHLQTLYITNASSQEEPRHSLIYHYITDPASYRLTEQIFKCCLSVYRRTCTAYLCISVINRNWSSWSKWSKCSKLCNGGDRQRTRECNNSTASDSGEGCQGIEKQEELCNTHPCSGRFV